MHTIRRHFIVVLVASLLEAAMYAAAVAFPANKGIVMLVPLLLPGTILGFFVGGGMSLVDGLAPAWRMDLAAALGFLLNTTLMYSWCLLVAKVAKLVRPAAS